MSLNQIHNDEYPVGFTGPCGAEKWKNFEVNSLQVCDFHADNYNIEAGDITAGPPNTFLHTDPGSNVTWIPISGDGNIYENDGQITDPVRNVDFDGNDLVFDNSGAFRLNQALNVDNAQTDLLVRNSVSGDLEVRQVSSLPDNDTNIYNSDGSLDANRNVDQAGFNMNIDNHTVPSAFQVGDTQSPNCALIVDQNSFLGSGNAGAGEVCFTGPIPTPTIVYNAIGSGFGGAPPGPIATVQYSDPLAEQNQASMTSAGVFIDSNDNASAGQETLTMSGSAVNPLGSNGQTVYTGNAMVATNAFNTNNANTRLLTRNANGLIEARDVSSLPDNDTNIYNSDGSLSGNRLLSFSGNTLSMANNADLIFTNPFPVDNTETVLLCRDAGTGAIQTRDVSTLPAGPTPWVNHDTAPNDLLASSQADRIISFGSSGSNITSANANDSMCVLNSINSSITNNGSLFNGNHILGCDNVSIVGVGGNNIGECGIISSKGGSLITNESDMSEIIATENCSMTSGRQATILSSEDTGISNSTRLVVLASNDLTVPASTNNQVVGGNAGGVTWSLNSSNGNITATGNVGGNTLSGTLTESDVAPGANGQLLTTVGGVSTWANQAPLGFNVGFMAYLPSAVTITTINTNVQCTSLSFGGSAIGYNNGGILNVTNGIATIPVGQSGIYNVHIGLCYTHNFFASNETLELTLVYNGAINKLGVAHYYTGNDEDSICYSTNLNLTAGDTLRPRLVVGAVTGNQLINASPQTWFSMQRIA